MTAGAKYIKIVVVGVARPPTEVLVFREADGRIPFVEWLAELAKKEPRAYVKCLERVLRLTGSGHELRRPLADYLEDGIYELRVQVGNVHYRILYFFIGKDLAVISHGCTKKGAVPRKEINRASIRQQLVMQDRVTYTAQFDV